MEPDPIFSHPRLARIYDALDGDRDDLDLYIELIQGSEPDHVLDVGCGTGSLATRLVELGFNVTGADPAAASLAVARSKPHAQEIRWICASAAGLPMVGADVATMTGNAAQVFLTDSDWRAALAGVRAAIRGGSRFLFETRVPEQRAWEGWTEANTRRTLETPEGPVEAWTELEQISLPFVTFVTMCRFLSDGEVLSSRSTLRFRSAHEVSESLHLAGYVVDDILDAPDRPGQEMVFLTRVL